MTCKIKDCPRPDSEHRCVAEGLPFHTCWGRVTHAHYPKKGMGGNNPLSKIVAFIDAGLHDHIDNGSGRYQGRRWGNTVVNGEFRIFDKDSKEILLEVPVL